MDVFYTHLAWCALVIGHFFNSLCSNELIISFNNYLGCLDIFSYHFVSCMRFSRYILFWLFYQSSEIKISFHLWSLVNPAMLNSTALLVGLTWRYFPLINTTIFHLSLCSCLYLYKKAFAYFLIDSAATYSPTPSPVQYHRPPRS